MSARSRSNPWWGARRVPVWTGYAAIDEIDWKPLGESDFDANPFWQLQRQANEEFHRVVFGQWLASQPPTGAGR